MSYQLLGWLASFGLAATFFVWWIKRRPNATADYTSEAIMPDETGEIVFTASMSVREVPDKPLPPLGSVAGPAYRIAYVNADGEASDRVITILDVSQDDGRTYVLAHCSRAQDALTFRVDRIREMHDHHTGEHISQPMQFFRQFFTEEKPATNEHLTVMSRARPGLIGLLWIALADRPIAEDNVTAMLDFIERRRALPGSRTESMQWDRVTAKQWLFAERPTLENADRALARMQRGGNEARLFRNTADQLIGSDKLRKRREKLFRLLT